MQKATRYHWTPSKPLKKNHNEDINSFLSMINGSGNETMSGIFLLRLFLRCFWQRHRIFVTLCDQYRGWPRILCSNYNKPVDWMDHNIELTHSTFNPAVESIHTALYSHGCMKQATSATAAAATAQNKKSKTNTKLVKFAKEATLNDKRISVLCAAFTQFFFFSVS